MTIRDVAKATEGFVQFTTGSYTPAANATSQTITVTRIAGDSGPIQVMYATSDGTAVAGTDYTAVSGVLNFADGETVKTFVIPLKAGTFAEGTRTISVTLTPLTSGVVLGPVGTSVVTITSPNPASPAPRCSRPRSSWAKPRP